MNGTTTDPQPCGVCGHATEHIKRKDGYQRCELCLCFRHSRDAYASGYTAGVEAERRRAALADAGYGDPCECCGSLMGCYCHEHPHRNPKCPGNVKGDIR